MATLIAHGVPLESYIEIWHQTSQALHFTVELVYVHLLDGEHDEWPAKAYLVAIRKVMGSYQNNLLDKIVNIHI